MKCPDCPRWNAEAQTCLDGKLNPRTYEQASEVAQVMGVRVICVFNDHRERLAMSRARSVFRPPGK